MHSRVHIAMITNNIKFHDYIHFFLHPPGYNIVDPLVIKSYNKVKKSKNKRLHKEIH